MPKKTIKAEVKSFVGGLITEASVLNFPPNASVDEANFVLHPDGTRSRRLGIDFEAVTVPRPFTFSGVAVTRDNMSSYKWLNAGGVSGQNFIVVQCDTQLYFFNSSIANWSQDGYVGTLDISSLSSTGLAHQFASVDGRLVIVAGVASVGVVTYTASVFTLTTKRLLTRDVWGVQADSSVEADPSYRIAVPANSNHKYNLYNQGWGIPRGLSDTTTVFDPVTLFNTYISKYPSNSDSVWTGMQFQPVSAPGSLAYERMFLNLYAQVTGTTGPSAKGYYIIDLMDRGSSRSSNVAASYAKYPELDMHTYSAPADSTSGGASVVCEFAGRVFYSGFNGTNTGGDSRSPTLSNMVFFSRLVRSVADIDKCYQEGDPTSRTTNDIVDTDGGFIRITGAGKIMAMLNLFSSLMVFADNGIWNISGGSDAGFTATNYQVSKVSSYGCVAPHSVVESAGSGFVWTTDGIYVVAKNQFGQWEANSITHTTIQSFYDGIPYNGKKYCIGIADPVNRKLRWVYNRGTPWNGDSQIEELVFDTVLKAFYPNKIGNVGAEIYGISNTSPDLSVRYLSMYSYYGIRVFGFSYYRDATFTDWKSVNSVGKDAAAYVVTGVTTADDSSVAKQVPYLTMHFERTETGYVGDTPTNASSCIVRSMWDFTNTAAANKWGPEFQAYRYRRAYVPTSQSDPMDTGYEVVTSKNKLRGRGKSFSMKLSTEALKDCKIIGWNLNLNGNPST